MLYYEFNPKTTETMMKPAISVEDVLHETCTLLAYVV